MFSLAVEYSLEFRLDKCFFLYTEISYLRYLVSSDGIRPDPKNVEPIVNFSTPKNSKEVHSFVGLVSYFRKFV